MGVLVNRNAFKQQNLLTIMACMSTESLEEGNIVLQ